MNRINYLVNLNNLNYTYPPLLMKLSPGLELPSEITVFDGKEEGECLDKPKPLSFEVYTLT